MNYGAIVSGIHSMIKHGIHHAEHQIQKLKAVKKKIQGEHEKGISHIRKILKPHLDQHWVGESATDFDKERDQAHTAMHDIVNEGYLDYISKIEEEIRSLEADKAFFEGVGRLAVAANDLLHHGEKKHDELTKTINSINKLLGARSK
ncbi:DUF5082 domain-containing protein [Bacillus sp. CLL-7-23]|uniref:DUF5082 domain-containing protein n=1 Tax=Bacillus changyiensis TaxID=3004103 RepID=A0ABT4X6U2_9BACI|nr:DUF5082 family protein [Bacillus changyiensis]MDA7028009.1 DUF5082 domain-containing protein [Bacillus changyiensis]